MKVRTLCFGLISTWAACALSAMAAGEWAPVANQVAFMLDHAKATTTPLVGIGNVEDTGDAEVVFKDVKVKAHSEGETATVDGGKSAWGVINIPVQVYAMGREKKTRQIAPARYIHRLHVDVYLLIRKPLSAMDGGGNNKGSAAENFYLVKKGMDFADIPTKKAALREGGKEMGQAAFNIAVFVPRSAAYMLTEDYTDPIAQLKKPGTLAGYAVVASMNGEKCREYIPAGKKASMGPGETASSKLLDKTLFNKYERLPWWETRSHNNFDTPDVDVLCISETPFAMYYGRYYPRTTPTYGTPEAPEADGTTADAEGDTSGAGTDSTGTRESSTSKGGTGEKKTDYDTSL